jgi:hypothetical protein
MYKPQRHTLVTDSVLADFLASSKEKYLQDIRNDKADEWTISMGNEAGGKVTEILLITVSDDS